MKPLAGGAAAVLVINASPEPLPVRHLDLQLDRLVWVLCMSLYIDLEFRGSAGRRGLTRLRKA